MLLLPRRQPPKLLLRPAAQKPLQPHKHLNAILAVQDLALRPPNQLLDLQQTRLAQMRAQPLLHLLQHPGQEAGRVVGPAGRRREDLVHEAGGDQLVAGDALAHDEGLVGLGDAEALDEGARAAALGDEAERGEGRQEEGVGRGVDEVGEGDERGGQADGGAVEGGDEDLGVVRERPRDVEVVGDEAADDLAAGVVLEAAAGARRGYVCAAGIVSLGWYVEGGRGYAEKNRPVPVRTVMKMSSRLSTSRSRSPRR